jgi:hypothetical protein
LSTGWRRLVKLSIEPRLLDHFGIAMYNTAEKAVGELVANAYDADATEVTITLADDSLSVRDDGAGMTAEEVEDDYLRLGRNRRDDAGQKSAGGRAIIGNKGIGKLAGFGIASRVLLSTVREGERTSLTLDRAELESAGLLNEYELEPRIEPSPADEHGTEVVLDGLLEGVSVPPLDRLRASLARQIPPRPGWRILVNGEECSVADIPGERIEIADDIEGFGRVRGFYIIAQSRRGLDPGFAIRVRGRLVQDQTLFGLNQQEHGFFGLARIVGELNADFIDPVDDRSERDDFVVNTSRTGLNPDFPSVQALFDYGREKLRSIADGLTRQRAQERKAAAVARNPELEERLKALGPEIYAKLDGLLDDVIGRLARNESTETIDELVDLIIRYFESDAIRVLVEAVRGADDAEVGRLAELLAEYGVARITEVAHLLHSQLEVIQLLEDRVRSGSLEAEIHRIVARNIWLLRDDLTYWFDNRAFATQLGDQLSAEFDFASGQRPDLACYDNSSLREPGVGMSKLMVVEFKRPGITIGAAELLQVMQYKRVFEESLGGLSGDDIEVIVLGDSFDTSFDRAMFGAGYKLMSYLELLEKARHRYRELYRSLIPDST